MHSMPCAEMSCSRPSITPFLSSMHSLISLTRPNPYSSLGHSKFGHRCVLSRGGLPWALALLSTTTTSLAYAAWVETDFRLGYLDDISLGGKLDHVRQDLFTIVDLELALGVRLNRLKCDYIHVHVSEVELTDAEFDCFQCVGVAAEIADDKTNKKYRDLFNTSLHSGGLRNFWSHQKRASIL